MKTKIISKLKNVDGVIIKENVVITNSMGIKTIFMYEIIVDKLDVIDRVIQNIKKSKIKYYILGMASNILFKQEFYEAIIVRVNAKFKNIDEVSASYPIAKLNSKYINMGISSLLFLTMVPGSLGGAIYMNAGAFNKEIKDIVELVYFYDVKKKKIRIFNNEECKFSYRDSYFRHHETIILGAKIKLEYQDCGLIEEFKKIIKLRKDRIPYDKPSLGSVFKNFRDISAGKLIDEGGLKGMAVNDAKVSRKHANIIINDGNAKGKDVIDLINIIKKEIYFKYKRKLELEIIIFE